MQIVEVAISMLTNQLLATFSAEASLDGHADQVAILAKLLALKSRKLTPRLDEEAENELLDSETRIEAIEQLLEHCQFREIAERLHKQEREASNHFVRMPLPTQQKHPPLSGLEEVSRQELQALFETVYKKAKPQQQLQTSEEKWTIKDKIEALLTDLGRQKTLYFDRLFQTTSCREELIVTFLALLELIKQEKITITLEGHEPKFTQSRS